MPKAAGRSTQVAGTLTDEGVECQALREDESNALYTLVPREKLSGFGNGDHVRVSGTIVEASFCQQGTTIQVETIEKA